MIPPTLKPVFARLSNASTTPGPAPAYVRYRISICQVCVSPRESCDPQPAPPFRLHGAEMSPHPRSQMASDVANKVRVPASPLRHLTDTASNTPAKPTLTTVTQTCPAHDRGR